ncbi:unnamed protein product, partial [Adineta steineri]
MIEEPTHPLLHRQFVNRHNVKFFIRILVGLALAHIIGQQFRPSDATPNRKPYGKYRLQKTTINN